MVKALALMLGVLAIATTASSQTATTVKGDASAWEEVTAAWHTLGTLKSYRMRMVPGPGALGPATMNRPLPPGADKMSIVNEVVNPGRFRMVLDMPEMMTIEVIKVDKDLRRRMTLKGEFAQAVQAQPSLADQIFGGGIGSVIGAILDPVGFITGVVTNIVASSIMQSMMPKTPKFGVWTCEEGGGAPTPPGSTQASSPGPSLREVTAARLPDTTIDGAKVRAYDLQMVGVENGKTNAYRLHVYALSDRQMLRRMEMINPDGTLRGTMEYSDFDAPITIELPRCE